MTPLNLPLDDNGSLVKKKKKGKKRPFKQPASEPNVSLMTRVYLNPAYLPEALIRGLKHQINCGSERETRLASPSASHIGSQRRSRFPPLHRSGGFLIGRCWTLFLDVWLEGSKTPIGGRATWSGTSNRNDPGEASVCFPPVIEDR